MRDLNDPSNECIYLADGEYEIKIDAHKCEFPPSWPDRCDKPNWVVLYLVFVSFLFGSIAGIGLAYLMTK